MYVQVLNNDIQFFDDYSSGTFAQSILGESEFAKDVLLSYVDILTQSLVILIMFLLLFLSQDIRAFWVVALITVGCFLYFLFFKKYTILLGEKRRNLSISVHDHLVKTLSLMKLIKLKNKNKIFMLNLRNLISSLFKVNRNQRVVQESAHLWLETVVIVVLIGLMLFLLRDRGTSSEKIVDLLVITLITLRFFPAFSSILASMTNITFNKVAISNTLRGIEYRDNKNFFDDISKLAVSTITIDSLSFRYRKDDQFVVYDLNFVCKCPSMIGISGKNGSGKSTLLKLLAGLLEPTRGNIRIDNKNLYKENKLLNAWKMNIGYVDQEKYFINESISSIIGFKDIDSKIDNCRVRSCLSTVGLEETFKNTEQRIGEGGRSVSGGELQRINIARALYDNPMILIFDEITNNIDKDSVDKIILLLRKLKKERLIFLSSHDQNLLNECDSIINLDQND